MALKDIGTIQSEIDTSGGRGNSGAALQDLADSTNDVQGVLSINNAPFDPLAPLAINFTFTSNTWHTFNLWQSSRDTKGVQEQPTPGAPPFDMYRVRTGGAGNWNVVAWLKGTCDTAATVQIRQAVLDTDGTTVMTEPFRGRHVVTPGEVFNLGYQALIKDVLAEQKLFMQIRATNGAIVTVHDAQFWAKRG